MRAEKFWTILNENPWLGRLIFGENEVETIEERLKNPFMLGIFLARTLPETYRWIAFRPFSRRILSQEAGMSLRDINDSLRTGVDHKHWFPMWHMPSEDRFSRSETGTDIGLSRTVNDDIEQLRRGNPGCTIDAIVRWQMSWQSRRLTKGSNRTDPGCEALVSYDIYLV